MKPKFIKVNENFLLFEQGTKPEQIKVTGLDRLQHEKLKLKVLYTKVKFLISNLDRSKLNFKQGFAIDNIENFANRNNIKSI